MRRVLNVSVEFNGDAYEAGVEIDRDTRELKSPPFAVQRFDTERGWIKVEHPSDELSAALISATPAAIEAFLQGEGAR